MACPVITLDSITLTPHLIWSDENNFNPVSQNIKRTLGGGLLVYTGNLSAGRPITLESLKDQGWETKSNVDSIKALADIPGKVMSLVIGSQIFSVMFRHHEPPAFTAEPLIFRVDAPSIDYFLVNIKLIEVV